ncbi:AfsR/SARP family transcriptional regulator [Paractinoplanes rishiriensis]|uniref:OmpR/PhoB-type domain-containing protein n=1 Tax=Paractinoplanes rishiriensis TaxID=1050105 RepID=A0A919K7X6_9ACTN|nr:AfsR/SARP family transcriptional regulator [Actinoplanes rishiriensis]GIF00340.1 hypothetical protein Ari01nite_78040 [Actinoplanes rishiriensis]
MEFRILGPLEVAVDGRLLDLGRPKQRAVLGVLLLRAGTVVSLEHLVDELWGEDPPAQAVASLQAYVSHLRRLLKPDLLLSQPPGYRLAIGPGDLDATRFERLAAHGRLLLDAGEPDRAAETLRRALALWRGDVLDGLEIAPGERARLDGMRLAALEDRITADLTLGRHAAVADELRRLVAAHPYRENLRALQMRALYRSGRQAEALDVYQETRRLLDAELGIEPSPSLSHLHQQILGHAPELDPPAPAPEPEPAPAETFVGRAEQLAVLRGALDGRGRLVLVSGEPGIGKTRLAEEAAPDAVWGRCTEEPGAPPFWPWIQILEKLNLPAELEPGPGLPVVDVEAVRFRFCRTIVATLRQRAPLVLVLDDLHWADAGSLRLLTTLAAELHTTPILVIATYRAEGRRALTDTLAALARLPVVERLPLDGLREDDVRSLMAARLGDDVDPDDQLVHVVHDRSAGNPFFVVELIRLLGSRRRLAAAQQAAAHEVPEGVRDVLRRRISGLPEQTQAILLVAAVVGREFDLGVLRDVSGLDDDRVLAAVEAALLSGLILEEASAGRFRFTHALVREAIYDDVSRARQARLHARVAASLGDRGGAHWWLAAPVVGTAKALPHLLTAADRALASLAHEEAAELLEHALTLLAAEPPVARSELDIHLRLATLHAQLDGARSVAGRRAMTRVRALAEELADIPAYRTLYEVAVARGEHAEARELAERMVAAGGGALAHLAAGRTLWCLGDPAAAREHLVRSLDLAVSEDPDSPHEVTIRLQLAPVLDLLGERAAADVHLAVAIGRARDLPPLARAGVFTSTALIHALRRDVPVAGEHARHALDLAGPQPAWFSYAAAVAAWVRALDGDPAGGVRSLRASLDEIRSRGARHLVGWVLGLLAEAEALAGNTGEGLRLLREARSLVAETGERMYEGNLDDLERRLAQS